MNLWVYIDTYGQEIFTGFVSVEKKVMRSFVTNILNIIKRK